MAQRYIPVTEKEAKEQKEGGNIGLPFGLCEKYGISLPENATPSQAWDALQEKTGLSPDDFYEKLDKEEDEASPQDELEELLGEEFKGYKGQEAISKLLQEKRGYVKGAFHRDDIGDIDLLWGNDRLGLRHIILQRRKEKETEEEKVRHVNELLSNLGEAIEKAHFKKKNNRGNFEFQFEKSYIVIAPEYHGNQITYVLTAYKRN